MDGAVVRLDGFRGPHRAQLGRGPGPAVSPARNLAERRPTFVLARAVTYATLFIGLLLVFLPGEILTASGIERPARIGPVELAGILLGAAGGALALWCILAFAVIGKGTPAPFDPPRRLVIRGPYRYLRNPMYLGAAFALSGAALFYRSLPLFGYTCLFLIVTHVFVVFYEEPTLGRLFRDDYRAYTAEVRRWLPRIR